VRRNEQKARRSESDMKIKPIRDYIVVKRLEEDAEKKVGSIIIPDTAKEKPLTAEVIAVGSGRVLKDGRKVPLEVHAGDRVLIGKYSGSEVKLDGKEYVVLREDEVLGVVE
jgi:chaperonin GroES